MLKTLLQDGGFLVCSSGIHAMEGRLSSWCFEDCCTHIRVRLKSSSYPNSFCVFVNVGIFNICNFGSPKVEEVFISRTPFLSSLRRVSSCHTMVAERVVDISSVYAVKRSL